ncbi:hypothetical protein V5N11_021683 [Cardamine amara subsp. amara]|uniref:Uncharacterized protein n=1 Tax=Cardamine amara subsp. amara TaxID=228776 RepID=A0ABD1AZK0_CARAN
MWKRKYTEGLVPLRGARFWPSTEGPNVHPPPVPVDPEGNPITKQDKKRKKGKNESPIKKQPKEKKRIMHCGICGSPDHNSRFHKKEKRFVAKSSQAQSSQAALSSQPHSSQAHSSQGDLMYD